MSGEPAKQELTTQRQLPPMVKLNGREVSVVGYNTTHAKEHLIGHLEGSMSERWCSVACMAKTMFARNSPNNCDSVRKNIRSLFNKLLQQGQLLVIDYGGKNGQIKAIKLFENAGGDEQQSAMEQVTKMRRRGQLSAEKVAQAEAIINQKAP